MTDAKPKKKSSILRMKYAVPTAIILVLLVVFFWFFLDPLLKWGLISGGEFAFGAKVEVASLSTHLRDLSLDIRGVQVASKDNPMTNLVEVEEARFAVEPVPLLSKKVIIQEMRLTGVRWGTARKTSGALPPRKQKKIAKRQGQDGLTSKLTAQLEQRAKTEAAGLPSMEALQKAQGQMKNLSVDSLVNASDLQSLKAMDGMKAEYQTKAAAYENQLKALDVNTKVNGATPAFQALGGIKISSPQDAVAAKDKLDTARQKVQDLQGTLDQINRLKSQAEADLGQGQALKDKLQALKDQDLKALSSKFNLPSLSYGNVARALVGPLWMTRVNGALGLIGTARKYMPASKPKQTQVVQTRLRGLDVRFPRHDVPPDFLIKTILLSGSTGGAGKTGEALDFQGLITDVTSDPALLGRPTRIKLHGAQGRRVYELTGVLDHTREVPHDGFELTAQGLDAASLNLPASDYLPAFREGQVALHTRLDLVGDKLDTILNVVISGLKPPAAQGGGEGQQLLHDLWQGITAVQITARMSGTGDDLQMTLTSNLDVQLSTRLKAMAGEKVAAAQQKLKAAVDRLTAGKQAEVLKQAGLAHDGALGQIGAQQKAVQDKQNQGQKLLQQKQDEANQAVEKQKQQAADQVKNKAQEQLQNLFKH